MKITRGDIVRGARDRSVSKRNSRQSSKLVTLESEFNLLRYFRSLSNARVDGFFRQKLAEEVGYLLDLVNLKSAVNSFDNDKAARVGYLEPVYAVPDFENFLKYLEGLFLENKINFDELKSEFCIKNIESRFTKFGYIGLNKKIKIPASDKARKQRASNAYDSEPIYSKSAILCHNWVTFLEEVKEKFSQNMRGEDFVLFMQAIFLDASKSRVKIKNGIHPKSINLHKISNIDLFYLNIFGKINYISCILRSGASSQNELPTALQRRSSSQMVLNGFFIDNLNRAQQAEMMKLGKFLYDGSFEEVGQRYIELPGSGKSFLIDIINSISSSISNPISNPISGSTFNSISGSIYAGTETSSQYLAERGIFQVSSVIRMLGIAPLETAPKINFSSVRYTARDLNALTKDKFRENLDAIIRQSSTQKVILWIEEFDHLDYEYKKLINRTFAGSCNVFLRKVSFTPNLYELNYSDRDSYERVCSERQEVMKNIANNRGLSFELSIKAGDKNEDILNKGLVGKNLIRQLLFDLKLVELLGEGRESAQKIQLILPDFSPKTVEKVFSNIKLREKLRELGVNRIIYQHPITRANVYYSFNEEGLANLSREDYYLNGGNELIIVDSSNYVGFDAHSSSALVTCQFIYMANQPTLTEIQQIAARNRVPNAYLFQDSTFRIFNRIDNSREFFDKSEDEMGRIFIDSTLKETSKVEILDFINFLRNKILSSINQHLIKHQIDLFDDNNKEFRKDLIAAVRSGDRSNHQRLIAEIIKERTGKEIDFTSFFGDEKNLSLLASYQEAYNILSEGRFVDRKLSLLKCKLQNKERKEKSLEAEWAFINDDIQAGEYNFFDLSDVKNIELELSKIKEEKMELMYKICDRFIDLYQDPATTLKHKEELCKDLITTIEEYVNQELQCLIDHFHDIVDKDTIETFVYNKTLQGSERFENLILVFEAVSNNISQVEFADDILFKAIETNIINLFEKLQAGVFKDIKFFEKYNESINESIGIIKSSRADAVLDIARRELNRRSLNDRLQYNASDDDVNNISDISKISSDEVSEPDPEKIIPTPISRVAQGDRLHLNQSTAVKISLDSLASQSASPMMQNPVVSTSSDLATDPSNALIDRSTPPPPASTPPPDALDSFEHWQERANAIGSCSKKSPDNSLKPILVQGMVQNPKSK